MGKDFFTGQPIDYQAKYESLMSEYLSLVNEHNTLKTRIKSLAVDITGVWGEEIVGCTPEEAISAIEGKFSALNTKLETANKIAYRAAWEC